VCPPNPFKPYHCGGFQCLSPGFPPRFSQKTFLTGLSSNSVLPLPPCQPSWPPGLVCEGARLGDPMPALPTSPSTGFGKDHRLFRFVVIRETRPSHAPPFFPTYRTNAPGPSPNPLLPRLDLLRSRIYASSSGVEFPMRISNPSSTFLSRTLLRSVIASQQS